MAAADKDYARDVWADARTIPDTILEDYLDATWDACLGYLPESVTSAVDFDPTTVARYRIANVLHARDLWGAVRREGDLIGFDTFAVRARPLSDSVRAQLRPPKAVPVVG